MEWSGGGGFTRGFFFGEVSLIGLAGWPIWDFLGFEMEISVVCIVSFVPVYYHDSHAICIHFFTSVICM